MQKDSRHPSESGNMTHNQVAPQQPPVKSFQCSHCVLIFKTKIFLFEHLSNVHGFDVDSALRDAGLKSPRTNTAFNANPGIHSDDSGDVFACQYCVFKASSWDAVSEHEKKCHKKSPQKTKEKLVSSKSPETKIVVISKETTNSVKEMSPLQHKQAAGVKVNSSSVKSTSKAKCVTNSSVGLKTYNKPSQSIAKYFKVSSVSNVKPTMSKNSSDLPGLPNSAKGTLILHNSHSSSSPNSDGVFKVSATSQNDLSRIGQNRFLLTDHVSINNPSSLKSDMSGSQLKGPNKIGKRTHNDSSGSPPTKKTKTDKEKSEIPGCTAIKTQLSSSTSFAFEVSEDEEERKRNLVNGDIDSSQVYCCKHCDYSDMGIHSVCAHYQKIHPYIRYNSEYIQDPNDRSATFRCLQCPVEFSTVVDLKRHYTENHPEAPNVFTMQSHELGLVFKCFVCVFTTHVSKALKQHYQEKHPTHKVNNSLMYYRYSASRCQEGSSQLNTSEKTSSPKRSDRISLKSVPTPSKGIKTTPSQQSPTSKGADVALYQCKLCKFSHKSVIVMHVHYQKCHPEAGMTIDKIKHSTLVMSSHIKLEVTPEKISESPNSVTVMDKSLVSPQNNVSDSSRKTRDKHELFQQKKISLSLKNPKDTPEASPQNLSASSKDKDMDSAEVRIKVRKSPTQTNGKLSTGMDNSSSSSPQNEMLYCQFCNYSSPSVRSVIGHHNAKHTGHTVTTEEIFRYSAKVQNQRPQSKAEASASSQSSDSNIRKRVEAYYKKYKPQHEDEVIADTVAPGPGSNVYEQAEDLFFCPKCNFGHPSIKGVLNHQIKRHRNFKSNTDHILRYTAMIRGEMKKSQAVNSSSFSAGLPLAVMDEGDEGKLFCYLCNSRQKSLSKVLEHYKKRHPGLEFKAKQVFAYSSMVHDQGRKSHLKTTAEQAVMDTFLGQSGNEKKPGNSISVSPSPSKRAAQTRSLRCHKCTYKTQHVYLLKRHLRTIHKTNHTITDVLQMCFKDGILQSGYHCEWCVFSHKEAARVHQHCQEQHSARGVSLEHITARLYVSPKASTYKKKKPHLEHTDDTDDCDNMSPSQPSGKNETKTYPCRACSFKGSSLQCITSHYHAVHPWSVKEDGSVLDVITSKVLSVNRQVQDPEDHSELSESFESYQVPLEFETLTGVSSQEATASSKLHKCRFCPAVFQSQRGLNTHYARIHPEIESSDDEHEVNIHMSEHGTRLRVFKCPCCTYVNTSYHGTLTHCQMQHPALTARADELQTDEVQLPSTECLKTKGPEDRLRCSGYMCKICPVIRASLKKLKIHYEQDHKQTVPNLLKPAQKHSATIKKQLLSKYHGTQGSVLQTAFFKNGKYAKIKCLFCKYVCSTKIALSRHLRIHHKNESEAGNQDCMYKCCLCSYSSVIRYYLARHYTRTHGKAAFIKYYVPVHQKLFRKPKPTSVDHPVTQYPEDTPETSHSSTPTVENKELIYKCPRCTYVNTSSHGILTHCQMKHPALTVKADKLQTDEVQLPNMDACVKTEGPKDRLKFRGYMCKFCPVICASLKKLKIHYEQDHNQTVPNLLKPAAKHSALLKKQLQSKYHGTQGSVLHATFFKNKKSAVMKCRFCKYVSTTKISLSHHLLVHHKNASEAGNQDCVYKCCLCSYSSVIRKYLAKHYTRTHGKAAFIKYYVPVHQKLFRKPKPTSVDHPGTQHPDTPETPTVENKELIYKCHLCTYSASFHRYLGSHYKKTHGHAAFNTYFVPQYKLEQYTKCNNEKVSKLPEAKSEESAPVKCKKCPNLLFNSSQLLSVHYTHFHSTDFTLDFTVLSRISKKGSEVYECGHCSIKIRSIGELCCHLDHHRELCRRKANTVKTKTPLIIKKRPEAKCIKLKKQDELPEFETVPELARWNVTKIETFTLATSPPSSPSKTPEMKEPELKSREEGYTCKQCRRTFMSLTGLRVHEHSHAAMAALKRLDTLPTSSSKHIFNKYIRYQSGTVKPFRCGICSYRTTIMGLLRSHLMKKHGAECSDISMSSAEIDNQDEESNLMADKEPPYSSDVQEFNCLTEAPDESEFIEKSMYSEPPNVQRQLNHYSLMAKVSASAPAALQDTKLPEDSLLHCEFCNFSTGHLSSIRRHYSNRHGKKILRCKDCCFFTGLRKTLEMHMETGHSNCPSEPTHLKDLRCPLCLYQTKNKNNMIDHIVLHREERVMAIEVRRPKLSRYLEGVIFRCHKCTFTSANAENLRLHMLKHDDIKPYKCRLCYFDCTQLSDLEAHLCDKHQVMRNHELVGQINLDQFETKAGKMCEEEEALSNFEQQNNEADDIEANFKMQGQEVEMENTVEPGNVSHENQEENTSNQKNEEYVVKLNEVPHQKQAENLAENDIRENVTVQNKKLHQKQGQDTQKENTESPVKSTALVFQYENIAKQNNIVHQKQEQETQGQAGDEMFLADTANGQQMENMEQKGGEGNRAKINFEEGLAAQNGKQNPKKEGEMDENPSQHNPSDSKEDTIKQTDVAQQGQETAEESSTKKCSTVETAQASKLHMKSVQGAKVRMQQNIETKIEDDILRQILVLDEEGSIGSLHNSQKGCEVKTEVMPATAKQNHMLAKDIRPQECSTAERLWLTAKHNRERVKICLKKKDNKESLGVSFISCKEEQVHGQRNNEELADPYGEMPVLENEYLKEEMHTHGYQTPVCKEEEWGDYPDQKQRRRDEKDHEDNMNQYKKEERGEEERIKEADYPLASNGAFTATDGVLHPSSKDEKLFACKFCGRNLIDSTELERHIMRHGM